MNRKCILFPVLFLAFSAQAQGWKWAQSLGPVNYATTVKTIRPYTASNVLICGSFAAGSLSLGNQTIQNAGQDDGYIALTDADGQYFWATGIGGSGRDFVVSAAAAPNGAFCAAGNFNSLSMNIGGAGLLNAGETDGFVVKYNPDKTIAWAKQIGAADVDEITGVALDADGSVLVCGHVIDKSTFNTLHTFVRKFDASGNLLWEQKGVLQHGELAASSLALDENKNIYFSGSVYGLAVFDNNVILKNDTSRMAFIVKYSANGALLTNAKFPQIGKINALELKDGKLSACGEKINYQIGWGWPLANSFIHVLRLNSSNLAVEWYKTAGANNPYFSLDIAQGLSVDAQNNLYVTGYFFSDTLKFAGLNHFNVPNVHYFYPQIFVLKYAPSGEELWAKTMGGLYTDEGTGILAVGDDQFYLCGNFDSNPAAFGSHKLHNTGTLDSMYVHLRPSRYFRASMGYLALFDKDAVQTLPEPEPIDFSVFPNPATDRLNILWNNPSHPIVSLQIIGADGRILRRSNYPEDPGVDLAGLPPGVYGIRITTDEGAGVKLFLKH